MDPDTKDKIIATGLFLLVMAWIVCALIWDGGL